MLVQAGLEHEVDRRDRRRLRGGLPCRRGRRQHPAGARLPARHRAHRRDARAGRGARGPRACLRDRTTGNVVLRRGVASRATGSCRATRSTSCGPATAARSSRTSATPPTSRCGRPPASGRSLKWPTDRWGEGYPGWHLECSAMARRYLGDRFDLHTGGIDNVFPHHEDEIAQSAPLVGGPPARLWVHGEHLLMAGRKMAKSAGNFQRVTELAERGHRPAGVPLPRPDLALRPQAQLLRHVDRRRRGGPRLAAGAPGGARSAAGRRAVGGAAGPRAPAPAGDRPTGIADGVAGFGGDRATCSRIGPTSPSAPLSAAGRACTTGSSPRSTTTSTCRRPWPSCARRCGPTCPPTSVAGWSSTPTRSSGLGLGAGCLDGRGGTVRRPSPRRSRRSSGIGRRPTGARFRSRGRIRADLAALGWEVTDTPEGSAASRR